MSLMFMPFRNFFLLSFLALFGCDEAKVCSVSPQKAPELLDQQWAQKVPLKGGLSGSNLYKVSDGTNSYVIRNIDNRSLEDRVIEIKAQQVASDAGYGPKLIAYDLDKGILLMEYLRPSTTAMLVDQLPEKLATLLHQIHDGPTFCEGLSIVSQIANRFDQIKQYPSDIDHNRLIAEIAMLKKLKVQKKTATHRDLNPNNFIWQGDSFKVIDFENAAEDDPFFDVATVTLFYFHDESSREAFWEAYFKRKLTAEERNHLAQMRKAVCLFYGLELLYHIPEDVVRTNVPLKPVMEVFMSFQAGTLSLYTTEGQFIFAKALLREAILD
jgi:thiamine kinase-like enzyme